MQLTLNDNGGRRQEGDRRLLVSENYSPERRAGKDRRSGEDRRQEKKPVDLFKERRQIYELLSA